MNAQIQPDIIPEIEREVLGSLLSGGDFRRVSSTLEDFHFIEPVHRVVFSAIKSAYDQYNSCQMPIVSRLIPRQAFSDFQNATQTSLSAYMARMISDTIYGSDALDKTAKKVVQQWARYRIAEEAELLRIAACDPVSKPEELATKTGLMLDEVLAHTRRSIRKKSQISISGAVQNAIAEAREAAKRGNGLTGITWGLTDINRATGGIQKRDLTLIGARPSMGKTTVALSVALKAAAAGAGIGFISLEMDSGKLGARALTDIAYDWNTKVPYQDILTGHASPDDIEELVTASSRLDDLPLIIEEQSGLSITDIRVKLESMLDYCERNGQPFDALFIDHLGLIRASSRYAGNRTNEIAEMTSALKSMAREYDIAVVALSQLNRGLETQVDKRPQLSSLRDSGAIEQDADTIIFLYREAYYLQREKGGSIEKQQERAESLADCQNKLEFMIAKQRNGPVTNIDLFIDVACSAVRNKVRY